MKKSLLRFLLFVLITSIASCGGYQSISYYNDAIYNYSPQNNKNNNGAVSNSKNKGTYYKDYFSNKALQANQEDILFKNPDDYQNNDSENADQNDYIAYGSWGDKISRININYYSSPYRWSYYPYYYGSYPFSRYSTFWGYMYNPWYFPYEYSYYPYYGRSRFSHFYYNPYRSYYWNSLRFTNIYDNPIIYSRLRGARSASSNSINGERTYNPTRSANTGRIVTGNNQGYSNSRSDSGNRTSTPSNSRDFNVGGDNRGNYRTNDRSSSNRSDFGNSSFNSRSSSSNSSFRRSAPSPRSSGSSGSSRSNSSRRR